MKRPLSSVACFLSCLAGGLFILVAATQLPYAITKDSEGWSSMFFRLAVAPGIGGGALLLGVIPSAILYAKGRHRVDLVSLWVSSTTVGLVIATWLLIEPLRHSIIFGD